MKFAKSMALLAGTMLMSGASVLAQSEPSALPPPLPDQEGAVVQAVPILTAGGGFGFVGFESGLHGPVVKGAPFSAQAITETTQTLADGNRIDQTRTTLVYRDSQGRTRRDDSLPALGPLAASGTVHHAIFVNDPVAGVHYVLDPDQKVAHRMSPPADIKSLHEHIAAMHTGAKLADAPVTESLGTQTIEGLTVTGTRRTLTIPAGQIGNEKPMQIVIESWYSPDLQMVIYSKRTDPRMGETVYQVTNIQRSEPDASLFQVPLDYTVQDGPPGHDMLYMNKQQ
jgi:hypothetical protein